MQNKLTPEDLDALEKLHREATPAPWYADTLDSEDLQVMHDADDTSFVIPYTDEDARCIATAHSALPALLDAARQAGELRGLVRELLAHMIDLRVARPYQWEEEARALGVEI